MRYASRKRAEQLRLRRAMLRRSHGPEACHRCWQAEAVDPHELLSRARGGSITDPFNVVPLCRPCHDWVTEHPAEAEEQGWSRPSPPATR